MVLDSEDFSADEFVQFGDAVVELAAKTNYSFTFSATAAGNFAKLLMRIGNWKAFDLLVRYVTNYRLAEVTSSSAENWVKVVGLLLDNFSFFSYGSFSCVGAQDGIAMALIEALSSSNEMIKECAASGLERLLADPKAENSVKMAFMRMATGQNAYYGDGSEYYFTDLEKENGFRLLARSKNERALSIAFSAIEVSDSRAVIQAAAQVLGNFQLTPERIQRLGAILPKLERAGTVDVVMPRLEECDEPMAIPLLCVYRPGGLANLPHRFNAAIVLDAHFSFGLISSDAKVREYSATQLANLGDKRLSAFVLNKCEDPALSEQCAQAIGLLSKMKSEVAWSALVKIYRKSAVETVKEAVKTAFLQLAAQDAVKGMYYLTRLLAFEYARHQEHDILSDVLSVVTNAGREGKLDNNPALQQQVYALLDTVKYDLFFASPWTYPWRGRGIWLENTANDTTLGRPLNNIARSLLGKIAAQRKANPVILESVTFEGFPGRNTYSYEYTLHLVVLGLPAKDTYSTARLFVIDGNGRVWQQENWFGGKGSVNLGRNQYTIFLDARNPSARAYIDIFDISAKNGWKRFYFTITNPHVVAGSNR
jgi:hypothetical protein